MLDRGRRVGLEFQLLRHAYHLFFANQRKRVRLGYVLERKRMRLVFANANKHYRLLKRAIRLRLRRRHVGFELELLPHADLIRRLSHARVRLSPGPCMGRKPLHAHRAFGSRAIRRGRRLGLQVTLRTLSG